MPKENYSFRDDLKEAVLEMKRVAVIDQPGWPAYDAPYRPAVISFRVVWKSTGEPIRIEDPYRHFRFEGYKATTQMEAAAEVPSLDFSWKSDPLESSSASFGVIGNEVNGKYYVNS